MKLNLDYNSIPPKLDAPKAVLTKNQVTPWGPNLLISHSMTTYIPIIDSCLPIKAKIDLSLQGEGFWKGVHSLDSCSHEVFCDVGQTQMLRNSRCSL